MELNNYIKAEIELTCCTVHDQNPLITIVDKHVVFECCCDDFEIVCLKKTIDLIAEDREHQRKFGWIEYNRALWHQGLL